MGWGVSMFRRGFNSSKCKTEARLAMARIKLLRNRREALVRQMRRDVAMLLDSNQDSTARIRVEHVIREQNIMAANEIVELFCELIVVRLPIIAKQRVCPADLKEGISSLIFAAPRCSDIPELLRIRDIFEKKYGKDFVSAATDLRPDSGVNRTLIEKLSVRTPSGEVKMKIMKEIAKEYQIDWDTTESELELLKPPEQLLDGPRSFVSASSMPVKPTNSLQGVDPDGAERRFSNDRENFRGQFTDRAESRSTNTRESFVDTNGAGLRSSNGRENFTGQFKDTAEHRSFNSRENFVAQFKDAASAAQAAAELAEKAAAAAQAAALLAKQNSQADRRASFDTTVNDLGSSRCGKKDRYANSSMNSHQFFVSDDHLTKESALSRRTHSSQNYDTASSDDEMGPAADLVGKKMNRRHSYNIRAPRSDIKFDDSDELDSDCDEVEMRRHSEGGHPPPSRPAPSLPPSSHNSSSPKPSPASHVHPKLPDYEEITARFEALRRSRS